MAFTHLLPRLRLTAWLDAATMCIVLNAVGSYESELWTEKSEMESVCMLNSKMLPCNVASSVCNASMAAHIGRLKLQ